jgi:catechol 2,3-dioxygenase-like lactoylglutathione lyase family enzyme
VTFLGFDHVQLAMPPGREDDARAFYGTVLGLEELPKPPALAARGGCWFRLGAQELHLGVEDGFRPALKAHPGLVASDFAGLRDRLAGAGVEVVDDELLPGVERVYFADPFGNRLEARRA